MATRLEELQTQNEQINVEKRRLKLLQKDLWAEMEPLLAAAEAERKERPTPGAEPQTIG